MLHAGLEHRVLSMSFSSLFLLPFSPLFSFFPFFPFFPFFSFLPYV